MELDLPKELGIRKTVLINTMGLEDELLPEDIDNDLDIDYYLSEYLSNEYGFLINSFSYETDTDFIYVSNIEWDTEEE